MTRINRALLIVLLASSVAVTAVRPGFSAECAPGPVSARGEPSVFKWLALTKAKGNWRAKVRRTKGLGGLYADWNQAESRTKECGPDGKGIACTVTAVPCHP